MKIKNKKMFLSSAIIFLLVAVVGIVLFDRDDSVDFEERLEIAGEYLKNSDYDNAIAIYNGVLAEDDSCSEAYICLAEAYYTKNNKEKSLEILEKGLEYSADEDAVVEKIQSLFPEYDLSFYWGDEDEYYAEASDETESETITEDISSETEAADISEETTTVPETEETTDTTTEETTTAAAPVVTTVNTTTAAQITTTTAPPVTTAVPVMTTTVPITTTTAPVTTTTTAAAHEPEAIIVEDFTVMTVAEARAWCRKNNLSLAVIGEDGFIISQSPAPGSIVMENSEVIVRCE